MTDTAQGPAPAGDATVDETPGLTADLVIVGTSLAAVSLATQATETGVERIVVVTGGGAPATTPTAHLAVDVVAGVMTGADGRDGRVVVTTDRGAITASAAAVFILTDAGEPPCDVPASMGDRVHLGRSPGAVWDADVLIVGRGEEAADLAVHLATEGTGVVLARGAADPARLSRLARRTLLLREAERRLTVLWHSWPTAIDDIGGFPMVSFDDVGTPDLQFDHVVFETGDQTSVPESVVPGGAVWIVGDGAGAVAPGHAWEEIRRAVFPQLAPPPERPRVWRSKDAAAIDELRTTHYNADITHFARTHSDLWVLAVRPDHGDVSHDAGQYASLGLGYWEPRGDGARDPGLDHKWGNLIRRSYSISSPVFDDDGYLTDPSTSDTLEFYIVLVPPTSDRIPALTPRLALRQPGDRMYVGPRVVGRYTLAPVTDPESTVVLLSTGTGEAPHNAMVGELLRKGHTGPIVSVVSVRYGADLGYLDTNLRLEGRWPNYHYLPLVTRDPDQPKRYIQDVIRDDVLTELGVPLEPATTHVYLCGNPAMIGSPTWDEDRPVFPEVVGACQLLAERGFDLDRRGHVGNVHSEKYW